MIEKSISYLGIRIANGLLSIASLYALTHFLSGYQYGIYAIGFSIIAWLSTIFFQWLNISVARMYAASPEALLNESRVILKWISVACLLLTGIALLFSETIKLDRYLIIAIGFGTIAMGFFSFYVQVANSQGRPDRFGRLSISRSVVALLSSLVLIYLFPRGEMALFGVTMGCLFSVLIFGSRSSQETGERFPGTRGQIFSYGIPFAFAAVATSTLDVAGKFLLGWFGGPGEVPGYAVACDLTQQTIGSTLNILYLAGYPTVTMAWESGNIASVRLSMEKLTKAFMVIAPYSLGIFIGASREISEVMFGHEVASQAALVMPWIAVALTAACLKNYILDIALSLSKGTYIQAKITITMAILNITLCILTIPFLGVLGASMSLAIAFSMGATWSYLVGRNLGIYPSIRSDAFKAFISFAFMQLGMFSIRMSGEYPGKSIMIFTIGSLAFILPAYLLNLSGFREFVVDVKRRCEISRDG